MAGLILKRVNQQPYKKIIVWCGIIQYCEKIVKIWKEVFNNYSICIDTSLNNEVKDVNTITYEQFYNKKSHPIMILCL